MGATDRTLACPECGSANPRGVKFCAECGLSLGGLELDLGTLVGNYRLLDLLGEGGMGRVYVAEHVTLGRRVAIKKLRSELTSNPSAVARFFAEARAVNRISHDNIIEITDFVEQPGGDNYIVMELLKGEDLGHRLQRKRVLALPRALDIAAQTASALAAAHASGIIHRDLKPDNIFLIERGGSPDFVKVLDFGVAKLTDGADRRSADVHVTAAGQIIGTPEYMSPEQAAGRGIDARTDIYALGVILYEMVTGVLPFQAKSFGDLLLQHMTSPVVLPGLSPGLPNDLLAARDQLILDLLAKDPAGRPRSMREVERRIHTLLETMTLPQRPKKRTPAFEPTPVSISTSALNKRAPISEATPVSTGAVARLALVKRVTPQVVVEIATPRSVSRIEAPNPEARISSPMPVMSPHLTPVEEPQTGRFARASTDSPSDSFEIPAARDDPPKSARAPAGTRGPESQISSPSAASVARQATGSNVAIGLPRPTRQLDVPPAFLELESPPEPEEIVDAVTSRVARGGAAPGPGSSPGTDDAPGVGSSGRPITSPRQDPPHATDPDPVRPPARSRRAPSRRAASVAIGALVAALAAVVLVNEATHGSEHTLPASVEPPAARSVEIKIKFVSAPPGATVRLEGATEPLGVTPFTESFPRSNRAVLLEFAKPGYVPIWEVVTFATDDALAATLTPLAVPPPPAVSPPSANPPAPHVVASPKPDRRRRPPAKPASPPADPADPTLERNGTLDVFKK